MVIKTDNMANKLKLFLFLLPLAWAGCKKEALMTYEAADNIYFYYAKSPGGTQAAVYYDTVQVNFGKRPTITQDSVVFAISLMGNIADSKRAFLMDVDAKASTAMAGVHYQLPPADSFYIPATASQQRMVIKIFRPASLRDTTADLYLQLHANEYFQTNLPVYTYSTTYELKATTLHIILDDRLLKPDIWDASVNALGAYSREKLELMVSLYKLDINKFYAATFYTASQLTSYAKSLQTYLNTQKSQGNTIYEKNGAEMKMGPAVQ